MRAPEMKEITPSQVAQFREKIYQHYAVHRRTMPWRSSRDPYHIVVSEIMLQQTQVERVVPKYEQFIETFPDFFSLAQAPLRDILTLWQGLGYNRRAMALQKIGQMVVDEHGGKLPDSVETLQAFPGIGPATAGAICAFAFNQPTVFIETNIRRVFIHSFFPGRNEIKDKEILPLVERTLDTAQPRTWYFALMDYGAALKEISANPNRRSAHHTRQPPFEGSNRQIRGLILKLLLENSEITEEELLRAVGRSPELVQQIIRQLVNEGFIGKTGKRFTISSRTRFG
jgi:A/G-specific adenine glycosylase